MKIHDISMLINEKIITYPGDMEVKIHHIKNAEQDEWNLTGITLGSHTGTHLDTPLHIADQKPNIAEIDLKQCYGSALVLDFTEIPFGKSISFENFDKKKLNNEVLHDQIILFKTINSKLGFRQFRDDWVFLSAEVAEFLVSKKIKAVGIDALTIGPRDTHEILLNDNLLIYEGLNLKKIHAGKYVFIGFPLKMETEGAPVRAVLVED